MALHSAPYPTRLFTERLQIRLADLSNESDVSKIIQAYNDQFIVAATGPIRMMTHQDVLEKCQRDGPKRELCTRLPADAPLPSSIFHLVHLKSTGQYIGKVGLHFRPQMPFPDLGYGFFEQFNGQGYAPEAGREVIRFWKEYLGVLEVSVYTMDTNVRSQRCAKKMGFVEGGSLEIDMGSGGKLTGRGLVLPSMTWPKDLVLLRPNVSAPV